MENLTDNERYILSMIGMMDRNLKELGEIINLPEDEIKQIINSINKKAGNLIKQNKETKRYYATPEAKQTFGDDFFNELKVMKKE